MQYISLINHYEGVRLSINNFPLRPVNEKAILSVLAKLSGIKTEATKLLTDELQRVRNENAKR